jgi:hypothetical protein
MVAATSEAFSAAIKDQEGATEALLKMFPRLNKGDRALTLEQWGLYSALVHTANTEGQKPGFMSSKDWDALVELGTKYGEFGPKAATDYYTNEFVNCQ